MSTYWVLRDGGVECVVTPGQGVQAVTARANVTESGALIREIVGSSGLSGLRLTRRGRALLATISLSIALPFVGASSVAAASSPPDPVQMMSYTVAAGESLWTIAERFKTPGTDTRDEVFHLKRLNHLDNSIVYAGQVLYID